jgi:hypothetical protein
MLSEKSIMIFANLTEHSGDCREVRSLALGPLLTRDHPTLLVLGEGEGLGSAIFPRQISHYCRDGPV